MELVLSFLLMGTNHESWDERGLMFEKRGWRKKTASMHTTTSDTNPASTQLQVYIACPMTGETVPL
jgi:hypothetical protein